MKNLQGYRTLVFAALVTAAGVATSLINDPTVNAWFKDHAPGLLSVLGVVVAVLRILTTGPVGNDKPEKEDGSNQ